MQIPKYVVDYVIELNRLLPEKLHMRLRLHCERPHCAAFILARTKPNGYEVKWVLSVRDSKAEILKNIKYRSGIAHFLR